MPPQTPLLAGNLLAFGVSYSCTMFDKWQVVPTVNGACDVIGAVRTFF
jgi:D-serine deaminase-like pyridoxal phosphate-dependent protein